MVKRQLDAACAATDTQNDGMVLEHCPSDFFEGCGLECNKKHKPCDKAACGEQPWAEEEMPSTAAPLLPFTMPLATTLTPPSSEAITFLNQLARSFFPLGQHTGLQPHAW